jgi:Epoxide hydrolase N terminus
MSDDRHVYPFRIEISQCDVDDLVRRLEVSRWPHELPDVGWDYGVSSAFLRELANRWRTDYDWRAHERELNRLPQFVTEIDGQTVHFVHQRSARSDALPLGSDRLAQRGSDRGLNDEEVAKVYAASSRWQERSGYATIQSTRPQTLSYALTDSPLGLLAWNVEWFVDYDPARTEQVAIDPDAILTDVTICWHTSTAGSSARLYKEARDAFGAGARSGIPTAVAVFPGDATIHSLAERSHSIVRWTEYDRGGHFASLQAPIFSSRTSARSPTSWGNDRRPS